MVGWGFWKDGCGGFERCVEKGRLHGIVFLRRGDAAAATFAVPKDQRRELRVLNRDVVMTKAAFFSELVAWVLPGLEFTPGWDCAAIGLRDGGMPAELGHLRQFGQGIFGIDLGEYFVKKGICGG